MNQIDRRENPTKGRGYPPDPESSAAAQVGTWNGGKQGQSTVSEYHTSGREQSGKTRSGASLLGDDSPDSALDRPLLATTFPTIQASRKRDVTFTLRQFKAMVLAAVADSKADLPWIKLGRFGNERTEKNSLRSNANMLTIDGIEGDYDGGRMTITEAAERLRKAGIAALLYESPSSTPARPRWRQPSPPRRG